MKDSQKGEREWVEACMKRLPETEDKDEINITKETNRKAKTIISAIGMSPASYMNWFLRMQE